MRFISYQDMFIDKTMGIDNDIGCYAQVLYTCPKPNLRRRIVFLCEQATMGLEEFVE